MIYKLISTKTPYTQPLQDSSTKNWIWDYFLYFLIALGLEWVWIACLKDTPATVEAKKPPVLSESDLSPPHFDHRGSYSNEIIDIVNGLRLASGTPELVFYTPKRKIDSVKSVPTNDPRVFSAALHSILAKTAEYGLPEIEADESLSFPDRESTQVYMFHVITEYLREVMRLHETIPENNLKFLKAINTDYRCLQNEIKMVPAPNKLVARLTSIVTDTSKPHHEAGISAVGTLFEMFHHFEIYRVHQTRANAFVSIFVKMVFLNWVENLVNHTVYNKTPHDTNAFFDEGTKAFETFEHTFPDGGAWETLYFKNREHAQKIKTALLGFLTLELLEFLKKDWIKSDDHIQTICNWLDKIKPEENHDEILIKIVSIATYKMLIDKRELEESTKAILLPMFKRFEATMFQASRLITPQFGVAFFTLGWTRNISENEDQIKLWYSARSILKYPPASINGFLEELGDEAHNKKLATARYIQTATSIALDVLLNSGRTDEIPNMFQFILEDPDIDRLDIDIVKKVILKTCAFLKIDPPFEKDKIGLKRRRKLKHKFRQTPVGNQRNSPASASTAAKPPRPAQIVAEPVSMKLKRDTRTIRSKSETDTDETSLLDDTDDIASTSDSVTSDDWPTETFFTTESPLTLPNRGYRLLETLLIEKKALSIRDFELLWRTLQAIKGPLTFESEKMDSHRKFTITPKDKSLRVPLKADGRAANMITISGHEDTDPLQLYHVKQIQMVFEIFNLIPGETVLSSH